MGPVPVASQYFFRAYVLNSDGAYEDVTRDTAWSASDPAVLRLINNATGNFITEAQGTAHVTGRYRQYSSSLVLVVIRPDVQGTPYIGISGGDPRIAGNTARAVATLYHPTRAEVLTDAIWRSSDPNVVTVDSSGLVTGVAPGTAQVSVSYDGVSAWYGLSVEPRRR